MVLLKTILIIGLVYYLFKILARWFAPKLFRYAAKKTEERFSEVFGEFHTYEKPGPAYEEGEVTIDRNPAKTRKATKKVEEYIDFEEIG